MKLYKFRPLATCCNYDRVISIIQDGFYCCSFLDFNDVNEGVFRVSQNIQNVDLGQKLDYKICSFSEEISLSSQLMWGHYAEAGMGVAIEIEVQSSHPLEEVKYGENGRRNGVIEILTNKSEQWRHEKEWRYLSTEQGKFYKSDITKIYFGTPYKNLVNYDEIKRRHKKLREYHRYSTMLKSECASVELLCEDYPLP